MEKDIWVIVMTKLWKHEVDPEWLKARHDVLTASEIIKMLPEYKRCLKKPGDVSLGFVALAYDKLTKREPDPTSVAAAARGHIMEPYAIEEWNAWWPDCEMYHWDDIIIKRNGLGFSPDGLNVPQYYDMGVSLSWSDKNKCLVQQNTTFEPPDKMLEVKCYEPKQHAKAILTDAKEADERWQVATALMVVPSLKQAFVMWYCPDSPVPMFYKAYERKDLEEEIEIITNMVKMFHDAMAYVKDTLPRTMANDNPIYTEEQIYKEYCALQSDNLMKI